MILPPYCGLSMEHAVTLDAFSNLSDLAAYRWKSLCSGLNTRSREGFVAYCAATAVQKTLQKPINSKVF